nr:rhomboid family intramembrane serine protease [Leucobacter edaphi]
MCQRCGRTICAKCQNVSPVGVLCPECVKQTARPASQRASRGARVATRRWMGSDAPITYAIMAACAVVFVLQLLGYYFGGDGVTRALWYAPLYSLPESFEPWRMVTAMFTHSPSFLLHILFNLYALWLFGRNLEQMIGRWAYLSLYLIAGFGGSLGVMLWSYVDPHAVLVPTVGASGAIFGVLAATLVAYRAARVNVTSLAVLLAINLGIGFIPGTSIAWQAHLGGMIAGAIAMWLLLITRGPRFRVRRIIALGAFSLVLIALSGAFFVALPDLAQLMG